MPFAIQTLLRLYGHIFSCFGRIAFKIDDSTYFKYLFPAVSIDIRVLLFQNLKKKTVGGSILAVCRTVFTQMTKNVVNYEQSPFFS